MRRRGPGAMAVDAPAHRERRLLADALHRFDGAVTLAAGDVADHMLAVIEVDEVGQRVDPGLHAIGRRCCTLSFSRSMSRVRFWRMAWQFMQTLSGGMPAWRLRLAAKWQ